MAKKLPSNVCGWGYSSTARIREAIGIRDKFSPDLHGEFRVDGWQIVVKRGKGQPKYGPKAPRHRVSKSSKHRIFVRHEGRLIPVGRVRQALCRPLKYRTARRRARK